MQPGSEVSILIAFFAGVLTFLSPCVLPLFPSYITYITGRSFEDIKISGVKPDIRKLTAVHSLFFIIGFSIVFVILGITLSYLGSFFGIKKIWLERFGGIVIILFGLNITGLLNIKFFNKEKTFISGRKNAGYFGSMLVGMAFAVGWTPCVGPILSSILIYASTLSSLPRAAVLLCSYSLGLGVPFFLAGLAINQFIFMFNRFKLMLRILPVITGIFLICFGALLFTGRFSRLTGIFIR